MDWTLGRQTAFRSRALAAIRNREMAIRMAAFRAWVENPSPDGGPPKPYRLLPELWRMPLLELATLMADTDEALWSAFIAQYPDYPARISKETYPDKLPKGA